MMNKKLSVWYLVFLSIFSLMPIFAHNANADTGQQIPQWFHDKATLWTSGQINDQEFLQDIHNLLTGISSGQTQTDPTASSTNASQQSGTSTMVQMWPSTNASQQSNMSAINALLQVNPAMLSHTMISQSKNCNDQNFPLVDWHNCDHSGQYLSHANLNHANLRGTNLSNAYMIKAYLVQAHLDSANLGSADLTNVDLEGADLHQSSLNWSTWRGANLTDANLDGANLQSANLGGADLTGAQLHCQNNPVCN